MNTFDWVKMDGIYYCYVNNIFSRPLVKVRKASNKTWDILMETPRGTWGRISGHVTLKGAKEITENAYRYCKTPFSHLDDVEVQ